VIPKVGIAARAAGGLSKISPRTAPKSKDEPAAATSGTKGDRIVVRATGDIAPTLKPGSKKPTYSASVDMPKFKKRTSSSAPRVRSGEEGSGKRPMSGFGRDSKAPKFGARGESARAASPRRPSGDRPTFGRTDGKPRFSPRSEGGPRADSRGPRADARGPRSDSRGPRPDSRGPRPDSRGPRSDSRPPARREGSAPGAARGFSRRPIARVKRRDS